MESKEFQKQRNICTMYKSYVKKSTSGITLIALVVTIIVLLILAGISINLILGDNGIITKATMAKEAQEMAQLKEQAELIKVAGLTGSYTKTGEYGKAELLEDLNNNFKGSTLGSDRITTSDGKYDIIVDDDLNISVEKSGEVGLTGNITMKSNVFEYNGDKFIGLTFEIEGLGNYMEYALEKLYPDKDITELEEMFNASSMGQSLTQEQKDYLLKEYAELLGFTKEQFLKMMVGQETEEGNIILKNESYEYSCKALGKKVYNGTDDLEKQLLEILEYEGTYEEALEDLMGYTQEQMESQWLEMNSAFTEYNHELCLKDSITEELAEDLTATVQVSNGDTFTACIGYGGGGKYQYEITEFGGEYTFEAELPDGRTGELTVIAQDPSAVVNPHAEKEWEMAWVYKDGAWSDKIEKGETATGDIVAKLYKTGNEITPPDYFTLMEFEKGPEYHLVIEGTNEMGPLYPDNVFQAWQKYSPGSYLFTKQIDVEDYKLLYTMYITEVYICDGITNIGSNAFIDFLSLKNIKIANTVQTIEESALSRAANLTTVEIPSTVTSIVAAAFSECENLVSVNIPEGVTTIETGTFSGCLKLESITIPSTVTTIGNNAFKGCESLKSITIPSGVTSIGEYAFEGCTNLASITIADTVASIGKYAFSNCTSLTEIKLPNNLTSVEDYLFYGSENLITVTIPSQVTKIGYKAFSDCASLYSVTISSTGVDLNMYAFENCTSLENITVPATIIQDNAFDGCTALKTVAITANTTSVGISIFNNCTSLTDVYVPSTTVKNLLQYEVTSQTTITVQN